MIADRNSCELKRIVDLLTPKATPAQMLFPQLGPPSVGAENHGQLAGDAPMKPIAINHNDYPLCDGRRRRPTR